MIVGGSGVSLAALMVVARIQVGHWQTSETLFEHAVRATPDNTLMHNKLGRAYARQDRLEEAADQYLRAIELAPRYIQPQNSLGLIRLRQGRLDEAIESFSEVIRLVPGDAPAHFNLGLALAQQGQIEEAEKHRQRALQLDPSLARRNPPAERSHAPVPVR